MAERPTGPDLDLADLDHLSRSRLRDPSGKRSSARSPPQSFGRELLALGIAYDRQERRYGGMRKASAREVDRLAPVAFAQHAIPPTYWHLGLVGW
jgi:hypothetical protein